MTTRHSITIKAGDYPPAIVAGLGDLVVTVPFGDTLYIGFLAVPTAA